MNNKKKKNTNARSASSAGTSPASVGAVQSKGAKRSAKLRASARNLLAVPAAMGFGHQTGTASFTNTGVATVVRHREFIGDINGSVAYSVSSFPINPGMASTFPWLSEIANRYECYRFVKLQFTIETTRSTTATGTFMAAVDYDAADGLPSTKQRLLSYAGAARSPVWSALTVTCPTQDANKFGPQRYTRHTSLAANLDIKTYDIGNLMVATVGHADTAVSGELYVEYVVNLYTPQLHSDDPFNYSAKVQASSVNVSKTAPLADCVIAGKLPISPYGQNGITFHEAGEYLLTSVLAGTVLAAGTAPTLSGTATSKGAVYNNVPNAAGTVSEVLTKVLIGQDGQNIMFDFSPVAATVTALDLRIAPYSYSLN